VSTLDTVRRELAREPRQTLQALADVANVTKQAVSLVIGRHGLTRVSPVSVPPVICGDCGTKLPRGSQTRKRCWCCHVKLMRKGHRVKRRCTGCGIMFTRKLSQVKKAGTGRYTRGRFFHSRPCYAKTQLGEPLGPRR
jgi:hypothetical protein